MKSEFKEYKPLFKECDELDRFIESYKPPRGLKEFVGGNNMTRNMQMTINSLVSAYKGLESLDIQSERKRKSMMKNIKKMLQVAMTMQNDFNIIFGQK